MVKQKLFILCLALVSAISLSGCTPSNSFYYSYDKGDCKTTSFDDADSKLDIELSWKYSTLYLEWEETENPDFNGYYIVRTEGTEDTCPYFYKNGDYHEYIYKKDRTYFKETNIASDTTYYYRVCVLETDNEIDCGSVMKVTIR